jgi:predicted PurR-regulated permease PerM
VEPRDNGPLDSPAVARAARVGIVTWAAIGVLVLGYWGFHYIIEPVRVIFPPLIVATVIVYLLNPLVSRLERRGLGRGWATSITYVVFFLAVGLSAKLLAPIISRQVSAFVATVPDLIDRAGVWVQAQAARAHLDLKMADLTAELQVKQGLSFFGRVASFTGGVIHAAVILILGPILAFYLLVDLPKLQRGVTAAIPARRRGEVQEVGHKLAVSVGGFFRGQLLVALFVGLASMLALWIVGLPYWALIGVICGIFNLVPLIGPYIAAVPAVFIGLTTPVSGGLLHIRPGPPLAFAAALALLIVQQIDNHIISPNVVARTVKLHPVTVMLSLLAGGTLLGLWGMLFAVPTVAAVKILAMHWWDTRASWPPDEPMLSEADVPPSDGASATPPTGRSRGEMPRVPSLRRRRR